MLQYRITKLSRNWDKLPVRERINKLILVEGKRFGHEWLNIELWVEWVIL